MNWYKIVKFVFASDKRVSVTGTSNYLGRYPKIKFEVEPPVPPSLIKYIIGDIRQDLSNRVNNGEKWILKLMAAVKQKYGKGDVAWIMFTQFKDGTYWVDPYYAEYVANKFMDLGYNSVSLKALGNKGVEEGSLAIRGEINPTGIVIQILGRFPGYIKEKIKQLGFYGEKVGNDYFWNKKTKTTEEQIGILSILFFIEEFNVSDFRDKAKQYFIELFRNMDIVELLQIKNKIKNVNGFAQEEIIPLIDNMIRMDEETGEIGYQKQLNNL